MKANDAAARRAVEEAVTIETDPDDEEVDGSTVEVRLPDLQRVVVGSSKVLRGPTGHSVTQPVPAPQPRNRHNNSD